MSKQALERIIILGAGGHARVLLDILKINSISVLGYVDREPHDHFQLQYLGDDEEIIKKYHPKKIKLVNGIGSVQRPENRRAVYERFKNSGYRFFSVVHPQAVIAGDVRRAEGIQILAGCVVNPGAVIEDNVILNTSSSVDHDCHIGAHTHIAPGVTISGGVKIGRGCHIGCGAIVIQGVEIGEGVLVGAGTLVLKNVQSGSTVLGIPGKIYDPKFIR